MNKETISQVMSELGKRGVKVRRKKYGKDIMKTARQARKFDKKDKSVS